MSIKCLLLYKDVNLSRYAAIIAEHQLAISREAEFYSEQLKEPEEYVVENKEGEDFNDVLDKDGEDIEEDEESITPSINIEEEKKGIIKTLQKGMLAILNSRDSEVLNQFNYSFGVSVIHFVCRFFPRRGYSF